MPFVRGTPQGERAEQVQCPGLIPTLLALLSQLEGMLGQSVRRLQTASMSGNPSPSHTSTSEERGLGNGAVCCTCSRSSSASGTRPAKT